MQSNWDQDMLLLDRLIDKLERQQQQLEDMLSKAIARANKCHGEYPLRLTEAARRRQGSQHLTAPLLL